jgi:5-methylcytosine-specific restriction endonuclease McrA
VPAPRICDLCQEPYSLKPGYRPGQRFCSKSCTRAWQNGARPPYARLAVVGMPLKTLLSRKRRLRRAQTWDGVRDAEILERDRWRCGICGQRIGKSFKFPHPRSKSIDHIVPLSQGGDDTAANKRAAHLGCNNGRCNRGGGEQLAMIG